MRRGILVTGHPYFYNSVSYAATALLARHGVFDFCRLRKVPGKRAMRFVDRQIHEVRVKGKTLEDVQSVEIEQT